MGTGRSGQQEGGALGLGACSLPLPTCGSAQVAPLLASGPSNTELAGLLGQWFPALAAHRGHLRHS